MKKKLIAVLLTAAMAVGCLAGCGNSKTTSGGADTDSKTADTEAAADTGAAQTDSGEQAKSVEELLLEPYEEPVDIHIVLQYRESEDPNTPSDCTPETSTAVKLLKEELNINLIYDWIVNADQYEQKFGAELAAGNLPDVFMVNANDFEDLSNQGGLADLTEYYEKYRCDDLDNIFNYDGNFINVAKKDGKIYRTAYGHGSCTDDLPNDLQHDTAGKRGHYFPDQLPKTIEEFEALCDKLMEVDYNGDGKTGGPVIPACKNYMDAQLADFEPFFHAYETWADGWCR